MPVYTSVALFTSDVHSYNFSIISHVIFLFKLILLFIIILDGDITENGRLP